MSVYLDPMTDWGKRIGRAGPSWCHMIADRLDERGETLLLYFIRQNPGQRAQEIQTMNPFSKWSDGEFKAALAALRESGQVRTKGVTRGTTYFAAGKGKKS